MKKILLTTLLFSFSAFAHDWNVKTNPVALLIGATNIQGNYALNDKFSVGVGGLVWSTEVLDIEFTASEYHARFDYWFNKTFEQGWYVGAQVSKLTMELTTEVSGVEFTGDLSSTGYLAHFGYQWLWENFNISLGTYFGYYDFDSSIELTDVDGNVEDESVPAFGAVGAEFFFGWAF